MEMELCYAWKTRHNSGIFDDPIIPAPSLFYTYYDNIQVDGKVCGAKCRNEINGEEFEIKAKCVINATGPFTDSIRLVKCKGIHRKYGEP